MEWAGARDEIMQAMWPPECGIRGAYDYAMPSICTHTGWFWYFFAGTISPVFDHLSHIKIRSSHHPHVTFSGDSHRIDSFFFTVDTLPHHHGEGDSLYSLERSHGSYFAAVFLGFAFFFLNFFFSDLHLGFCCVLGFSEIQISDFTLPLSLF